MGKRGDLRDGEEEIKGMGKRGIKGMRGFKFKHPCSSTSPPRGWAYLGLHDQFLHIFARDKGFTCASSSSR